MTDIVCTPDLCRCGTCKTPQGARWPLGLKPRPACTVCDDKGYTDNCKCQYVHSCKVCSAGLAYELKRSPLKNKNHEPSGCPECINVRVPNAWGCTECGRVVRHPMIAELATVTAERDRAQAAMSCAGGRLILKSELDAERAAHAETRKALEAVRAKLLEVADVGPAVQRLMVRAVTAESALARSEARLQAVASVRDRLLQQAVVFRLNPHVHSTYRECADRITKALTPATSPGAGEGTKCGVTAWNRWALPCDREPGHTGTHSHDPTPGRSEP